MGLKANGGINAKIKKLQDISNPDSLRYELYAILVSLILSKEEFKSNKDIEAFLGTFGIVFKDYVMKTRTLIMAKTLRIVEKTDDLNLYKDGLKKLYLVDSEDDHSKNKEKKQDTENYMNNLLKKYSRNKKN